MTRKWILQFVWALSAWSEHDFSLSLCVELYLPVLSFTVHRDWSGSLLLASPSSPPADRCALPTSVSLPHPHALPHPLQNVDFSLDAIFAMLVCTGNVLFDVLIFNNPPLLNRCP